MYHRQGCRNDAASLLLRRGEKKVEEQSIRYRIEGDSAVLMEFGQKITEECNDQVQDMVQKIERGNLQGIRDLIPAFCTLMVCYDPSVWTTDALIDQLKALQQVTAQAKKCRKRIVEIPVCYGGYFGPDLQYVADHAGMTKEEVIAVHSRTPYRIYMLGFLPGFPYLGGLDERLVTPRLAIPRTRIPAGSVGIGGSQTGIYPMASPGGWQLIGRTPLDIYDAKREEPFLYEAGDEIQFVPIDSDTYYEIRHQILRGTWKLTVREDVQEAKQAHPTQSKQRAEGVQTTTVNEDAQIGGYLDIQTPGFFTTVQDEGRLGYQRYGFSQSGVMDQASWKFGNALLHNPQDAAALEMTWQGASFTVDASTRIAVTGAECDVTIDGVKQPQNEALEIDPGRKVTIGIAKKGCRMYLCVQGGIQVPKVMGSRSLNLKCHIGGCEGRPLRAGDHVPFGVGADFYATETQQTARTRLPEGDTVTLRVIPDAQAECFGTEGAQIFYSSEYEIAEESDRMGIRLQGPSVTGSGSADIVSEGIAFGAVQVPSSGCPIILMADRQTTGGYAKMGVVCSEDLSLLAQCRPGTKIRFARMEK